MTQNTAPKDPKYLSLARHFTEQIRRGELQPGSRLPSFTQMREQFGATPATVERVYAALEREHLIERRHRSGVYVAISDRPKTLYGTIGFVALGFDKPHLHPYNQHLLQGIQQAASEAGIQILLLDRPVYSTEETKVDGVLICADRRARQTQETLEEDSFQASSLPYVSLLMERPDTPSVAADDYQGAYDAVSHLFELGHRRIAALMGSNLTDMLDPLSHRRIEGYQAALREAGLAFQDSWLRPVCYNPFETYVGRGRDDMTQWLQEGWADLGCTALLTQNDDTAIGVIQALTSAGFTVPEEVSVVGFDGAGIDEYFSLRLTTVDVPLEEIGYRGTQILLNQIANGFVDQTAVPNVVLPAPLRPGASTSLVFSRP